MTQPFAFFVAFAPHLHLQRSGASVAIQTFPPTRNEVTGARAAHAIVSRTDARDLVY